MSEKMISDFIQIGVVSCFIVLGILGVISTMYIKSLISKLDSLPNMKDVIQKVDDMVFKIQTICNNQSLLEQRYKIELNAIERRIEKIEVLISEPTKR